LAGPKGGELNPFITVSKTDKQFWPLLTGRFSTTHFAQPIRSLYVSSSNETITFKIVEKASPSLWGALVQWYSVARNIYLIFPIIAGLSFLAATYGLPAMDLVLASFLSLQFFLMSMTLYNDYRDYLNGIDRVNEYNSQKPLVKGLIRPFQARQLSFVFFLLSSTLAIYCFVQRPQTVLFGLMALVVALSLTSTRISQWFRGLSVLTNFILAGPLLVVGYEFLLYNHISLSSAMLGAIFGLHALKYDFLKQVREIFYNSKVRVTTMATWLGFERSKKIFTLLSLIHICALIGFASIVGHKELWLLLVVGIYFEFYSNNLIHRAASFLSSQITQALSIQKLHFSIESSLILLIFTSYLWLSLL
jgi:1,4-dihydroxy-2-naphthoate octaprenyltransferase